MNHTKLEVYKRSRQLIVSAYPLIDSLPKSEEFQLKSQMKRSLISVPSNIAEGAARGSVKEMIRFLNIAIGSMKEFETQLLISRDLKFLNDIEMILAEVDIICKMLYKLKISLKNK
ncbi:four helix bundle protein [Robertkochia aurantiaca]|uniref:four helix bundle protein n=1 Tax=Robertkochia aurantiaca TaxID=2873700 RepID=UPI001CCC9655|nr:four helix bundle protein [Robertkochia sp. 3YJGBD-33]